jgi:exopolyphosphatase / guanosine-5'-triphosphate,3'-diphosphate pyrophosphatase
MPQTARAAASHRGYARSAVRCACIDIGSNTTRLLVADVLVGSAAATGPVLAPVVERRAFTQLGRACRTGQAVPATTREALAAVVAAQAQEARTLGAEALRVVATAALRRSADGLATCHALAAAAGAPVELLSEQDEARLAFTGATCVLADAAGDAVAVVDVGGGSAQIVVGSCDAGPTWSVSLPLGSGDLTAAQLPGDPPAAEELARLRAVVEGALAAVAPPPVARALAVGGSATSLRRLAGPTLAPATLERVLATLVEAPAAQLAERLRIAPERARLLPAGIVVLTAIARRIGPLEVARGGLREGILHELATAG